MVRFLSAISPYAPYPSTNAQLNPAVLLRGMAPVSEEHSKIAPNSIFMDFGPPRSGNAHGRASYRRSSRARSVVSRTSAKVVSKKSSVSS